MKEPIVEFRIQRLVDDEMTNEERREFLESLDRQPESWREVALAFVEEQVWRREIGGAHSGARAAVEPGAETATVVRRTSRGMQVTLVACLLFLPCLGFYLGQVTQRAYFAADSVHQRDGVNESNEPPQVVQQPVFPQRRSDAFVQLPPVTGRTPANERLANLGYRLDSGTQYLSGQLDDGRRLVVPVRTMMVNYYGQ